MNTLVSSLIAVLLLVAALPAAAQSLEKADVYEFAPLDPPKVYKRDGKLILDPDFFCSWCAKKKKIKAKKRDDMAEQFKVVKKYPTEFQGRKERVHGDFKLMESPGEEMIEWLRKNTSAKKGIFMEDDQFRLFVDVPGFNSKKVQMPRREHELNQLHSVFPRVTDKTVSLRPEHVAHLYRLRAHRVLNDVTALVAHDPKSSDFDYSGPWLGMDNKVEIYIFRKKKDFLKFSEYTLGFESDEMEGFCWHNLKERNMVVCIHAQGLNDDELNNTFTHRLVYCLTAALRRYQYDLPSWVQQGFAHLMSRREFTGYTTYIFGEGRAPKTQAIKNWKPYVRKMVERKKAPPFADFMAVEGDNGIPWNHHPIAWSLMSFLMQRDQKATGRFLDLMKQKDTKKRENVRQLLQRSLKASHKLSPLQLEELWKAWVLETYPAF
jgi:hypothetical protein